MTTALLKNIKRAMAGEYSRELFVKVQIGKSRLAMKGFHLGAAPGYGLRRMLVDEHGTPKGELGPGQWKNIQSDHVILVLISRLKSRGPRIWQFGYRFDTKPDILLGARIVKRGGPIEDFFILPFMLLPHGAWIRFRNGRYARAEKGGDPKAEGS